MQNQCELCCRHGSSIRACPRFSKIPDFFLEQTNRQTDIHAGFLVDYDKITVYFFTWLKAMCHYCPEKGHANKKLPCMVGMCMSMCISRQVLIEGLIKVKVIRCQEIGEQMLLVIHDLRVKK